MRFENRADAGQQLAVEVSALRLHRPIILGLPRGGVPVAYEVARTLKAPLDVLIVRKLGVPSQPELAFGAVGESAVRVLNDDVVRIANLTYPAMQAIEDWERAEVKQRAAAIRKRVPKVQVERRDVVIVDDGLATGASAHASCLVAREEGAKRITLAIPVAPRGWQKQFAEVADECVALSTPKHFQAVGFWYQDFKATSDDEVLDLLTRSRGPAPDVV